MDWASPEPRRIAIPECRRTIVEPTTSATGVGGSVICLPIRASRALRSLFGGDRVGGVLADDVLELGVVLEHRLAEQLLEDRTEALVGLPTREIFDELEVVAEPLFRLRILPPRGERARLAGRGLGRQGDGLRRLDDA